MVSAKYNEAHRRLADAMHALAECAAAARGDDASEFYQIVRLTTEAATRLTRLTHLHNLKEASARVAADSAHVDEVGLPSRG